MFRENLIIAHDFGGKRLDTALALLYPAYSRSRIAGWIKSGAITVGGATWEPSAKVWGGEVIAIDAQDETEIEATPQAIALDVVYDDADILVINKPAGLVVHPGAGNPDGTLLNALLHFAPQVSLVPRAGIVHRLDKDTSGLMVVAKTLAAQTALVRQLQARSVSREYIALVHGELPAAQIYEGEIGRHPTVRTKMAVVERFGKDARTFVQPVSYFEKHTLVRCKLDTGRTHQIRVHLSHAGFPLVGDPVYGKRKALPHFPRQALHAERLALEHPRSEKEMHWDVPMPSDMQALIERLGQPYE